MDTNAIEAVGLRKTFGSARFLTRSGSPTAALDGLDLIVKTGEVHAFLGPNGAGKTTTIRILLGLLRQDPGGGTVTLLGGDPWRDATRLHGRLAYVPGDVTLWPGLTGGEIIDLLGKLRGDGNDGRRKAELIERFRLDPSKKARAYSKGNRQKVALIAALASDAELLLLDEPTSGLDPLMEEAFREVIAAERRSGRTVLLSSHILSEAEALADRVTIIRKGRTVETGTLAELRHLNRTTVDAETEHPISIAGLQGVHDASLVKASTGQGARLRCAVDNAALDGLLRELTGAGLRALTCRPPTLEELFLRHYADQPAQSGRPGAGLPSTGQQAPAGSSS